jgi:hypothetical protein
LVPVVLEVENACRKRTKKKKEIVRKSFEENQLRKIDYLWRK